MFKARNLVRWALLMGCVAGGLAVVCLGGVHASDQVQSGSPVFTPFQAELPLPVVKQPGAPFTPGCELRPEWGTPTFYTIDMYPASVQMMPGLQSTIWGYDGLYPGPTIKATIGHPVVIRFVNHLPVETSIHNHGGHTASFSDGFPNFFIEPTPPGGPVQLRD